MSFLSLLSLSYDLALNVISAVLSVEELSTEFQLDRRFIFSQLSQGVFEFQYTKATADAEDDDEDGTEGDDD